MSFIFLYLGKYRVQQVVDFFVHGVDDMLQLLDELFSVCVLIDNVNRCARLIGLGILLILTMGRQSSEPSKLQTQAAYRL